MLQKITLEIRIRIQNKQKKKFMVLDPDLCPDLHIMYTDTKPC